MSTFSISGLSSGLDTTSLIAQLMAVASQPQTQLKSDLTSSKVLASAYTAITDRLGTLATALSALGASGHTVLFGTTPTWSAATVASSSTAVVAAASGAADAGAGLSFDVVSLARAQVSTVAVATDGTVLSDPDAGFDLVAGDGTVTHLDVADGSAASVASAVNGSGLGIRAQVVATDGGNVLRLTSSTTGAAAGFSVNGLDSSAREVVAASDARIQVGDPAAGGYTVSSATNTFSGVERGVTFTVGALATGVTLTVDRDTTKITAAVQAAVAAVNDVLTNLTSLTAKGATLAGDGSVRPLAQALLGAVSQGDAGSSFSRFGISLTSDGRLAFDQTAFTATLAGSPDDTAASVGSVLAQRLSDVVDTFAAPNSGVLTRAVESTGVRQDRLQDQIDTWTTRLADQQTRLEARFSAMETALSRLKSQGEYLTSIFDSLDAQASSK